MTARELFISSMELIPKVFILLLMLGLAIPSTAHGTLYVAIRHRKSYSYDYIMVPTRPNGKFLWTMLDTGSWMSAVTGPDVHELGLDILPASRMGTNVSASLADGTTLTSKAIDIKMSLDGSHPFRTTIAIQPKVSSGPSLLSLHDFLHAYHGIDFKSCQFVETVHNTTWSACPQDRFNRTSTYENTTYGIRVQYPFDWSVQESNSSGMPITIATLLSPTGPNSNPTAQVSVYMDKLHNSTTTLNNYAHFVAFADYENRTSDFHDFRLLELSTNSSILAGKPAYMLIGTYELPSAGLQKLIEVGTIIGDKAYSVRYIADAPKYSSYLPAAQKIIGSREFYRAGIEAVDTHIAEGMYCSCPCCGKQTHIK